MISDSNLDFEIKPYSDVYCRIASKMLLIRYIDGSVISPGVVKIGR